MKNYLPHGDAELLLWLTNFNNKMMMHSATFNLMPADIADINTKGNALV